MSGALDIFAKRNNLFVKQTTKGCLQECLGCQAQSEFYIATNEDKQTDIMYALEESDCLLRTCCPAIRSFDINVSTAKGVAPFLNIVRPVACAASPCKCCCFQSITTTSPDGQLFGSVVEKSWVCVPEFAVIDANGNTTHNLHQPKCCGGMCVDISKGCCKRIPFNIYPVDNAGNDIEDETRTGSIVKIWNGLKLELFTDADKFELLYPSVADDATKANLLGAVFFLNQLFFEGGGGGGGAQGDVGFASIFF